MNYITSCPECSTQFMLSTAHLKAHRGKVQCGHCEHVFNAKNRITEVIEPENSAEYVVDTEQSVVYEAVNTELADTPESNPLPAAVSSSEIDTPIVIDDLTTDPKFTRKKFKFNIWLSLLSLLLLILAGLQTVYFMRSKIAAEYPEFKPLLAQGCAYVNCEIALPQNLESLVIDDFDMQEDEDHENVVNFSSLLINNANHVQAYPNIELTLTNTDDQAVLRRLIKPAEYLKTNTDIQAGFAAHEETRVKLAINVGDTAVAGYRVLLAY